MPETAWPENVTARYLTVGGATVDMEIKNTGTYDWQRVQARCTASSCGAASESEARSMDFRNGLRDGQEHQRARDHLVKELHPWAQSHAETCRAMPRPTA